MSVAHRPNSSASTDGTKISLKPAFVVTLLHWFHGWRCDFICAQVLQQEEEADKDWAVGDAAAPGGLRPRRLKQKWKEAVEEAADGSLPQRAEFTAGELDKYLDRLRARVVDDLGAAKRNVVSVYPEDYQPFQVNSAPTP